ncbi:MAG: spore coat protein [Oscillospiraceae bacterium]|jgi:spore coat protein CotF|nr:spore coat protein [Oscillospiraceae bacterium]
MATTAARKNPGTAVKKTAPAKRSPRSTAAQMQSPPAGFTMADQEIMDDILTSQKHITGVYNTYSSECVNQRLKADFLNLWRENQNLQSSVFSQMQQRGWYAPAKAQQKMVTQTKTKFQGIQSQLPK